MMSEAIWAAWHSGQRVPERGWKPLGDYMCQTARDVVRQDCLAHLQQERAQLEAQRALLDRHIAALRDGIVTLQRGGYGWEAAYVAAKESIKP